MNTKMRSEFWKCDFDFDCDHNCNTVNFAADELCRRCNTPRGDAPPASNVEVLVAWLQASDEMRREIEIASRPTKAGIYCRYRLGVRETIETWIVNVETDAEAQEIRDSEGRGLWEPLT